MRRHRSILLALAFATCVACGGCQGQSAATEQSPPPAQQPHAASPEATTSGGGDVLLAAADVELPEHAEGVTGAAFSRPTAGGP